MDRLGFKEGEMIEHKMISNSIAVSYTHLVIQNFETIESCTDKVGRIIQLRSYL